MLRGFLCNPDKLQSQTMMHRKAHNTLSCMLRLSSCTSAYQHCMLCRQTCDLCGQVSAKHFHCAAASRHSTRLFPKRFTGVGFDLSRSSTMATGYHCFVQENEPITSAGSCTKSPPALQEFVCKGMHWCSQRILSSLITANGHKKSLYVFTSITLFVPQVKLYLSYG